MRQIASWALLQARGRRGISDFWVAATAHSAIIHERRTTSLSDTDESVLAALSAEPWNSTNAAGMGARHSLLEVDYLGEAIAARPGRAPAFIQARAAGAGAGGAGGAGAAAGAGGGINLFAPFFPLAKLDDEPKGSCCPDSIIVSSGRENALEDCAAGWTFYVTATWLESGELDGHKCRCDCCEVRQFVAEETESTEVDIKSGNENTHRTSTRQLVQKPDGEGESIFAKPRASPFHYGDLSKLPADRPQPAKAAKTPPVHASRGRNMGVRLTTKAVTRQQQFPRGARLQHQLNRDVFEVSRENRGGRTTVYWATDFLWPDGPKTSPLMAPSREAHRKIQANSQKELEKLKEQLQYYGKGTPAEGSDPQTDGLGGKASACKYEYGDSPKGAGCTVKKGESYISDESVKLEFSIVIRPAEGCAGRVLEYRCQLEGGCTRPGPDKACRPKNSSSTC